MDGKTRGLILPLAALALALAASGCGGGSSSSSAPPAPLERIAPDASGQGPLPVTNSEFYKFTAACDNAVLPCGTPPDTGEFVELWAQVYRPTTLDNPPYPVIILLHGNHSTCGRPATDEDKRAYGVPLDADFHIDDNADYTTTGTCPPGYNVVDSHLGYAYFANRLASQGYVVVSINANRGITAGAGMPGDRTLVWARGRLVLRHLELLSQWNQGDASQTPPNPEGSGLPATLSGKLDFTNVGLFGHSRGGEGVRAAYALYRDGDPGPFAPNWDSLIPGMTVAGVFEVGPTDAAAAPGVAGPPLAPPGPINPEGTVWTVLLPMCDGDVSDLEGVRPYDRVMGQQANASELASPTQKSTFTVWGTNHNFYNTEWQISDSPGCSGTGNSALFPEAPGSVKEQAAGISSVLAFFRGNLKTTAAARVYNPIFNRNFNPLFAIPETVIGPTLEEIDFPTRVDRGYSPSPSAQVSRVVDDFDQATGTSSYGVPDDANGISITNVNGQPYGDFPCPVPLGPLNIIPDHDPTQRAGSLSWEHGGESVFLQVNWTAQGQPGEDLTDLPGIGAAKALEFRVSRRPVIPPPKSFFGVSCYQPSPTQIDPLNVRERTEFSIALAGADGSTTSRVEVENYLPGAELTGPVGLLEFNFQPALHPILQTVRIPLSDFGKIGRVLHQTRGVRFIFDKDHSGAIYIANVRFANTYGPGVPNTLPATVAVAGASAATGAAISPVQTQPGATSHSASIASISRVASSPMLAGASGVEIDINSDTIFPIRDESPILVMDGSMFRTSGYHSGDLHSIYFVVDSASFAALPDGAPVTIQYGIRGGESWDAGNLDKSMLPSN